MLKLPTKDEVTSRAKPGVPLSAMESFIVAMEPVEINAAQAFRTQLYQAIQDGMELDRQTPNECVWFEVFDGGALEPLWYWRLWAKNGRIVADSGEGYSEKGNAVKAAQRVMKHLRTGIVEIRGM